MAHEEVEQPFCALDLKNVPVIESEVVMGEEEADAMCNVLLQIWEQIVFQAGSYSFMV